MKTMGAVFLYSGGNFHAFRINVLFIQHVFIEYYLSVTGTILDYICSIVIKSLSTVYIII